MEGKEIIYVKVSEENTDGGNNIFNSPILEQNQVAADNRGREPVIFWIIMERRGFE